MWKIFVYLEANQGENTPDFETWLCELANNLRAEDFKVISDNRVMFRFPEQYDGNYDENGILL